MNERFAAQVIAACASCPIDPERLNVNGGGSRSASAWPAPARSCQATILYEMQRRPGTLRLGHHVRSALESVPLEIFERS
jgi:acetyl-CoA acetyltransferase